MKQLARETRTKNIMIRMYCRAKHHSNNGICPDCQELIDYSNQRLLACPYGDDKPACSNCPVHCYKPIYRDKIRTVMRYAGPRMIWHHPVLAIRHLIHSRKKDTTN